MMPMKPSNDLLLKGAVLIASMSIAWYYVLEWWHSTSKTKDKADKTPKSVTPPTSPEIQQESTEIKENETQNKFQNMSASWIVVDSPRVFVSMHENSGIRNMWGEPDASSFHVRGLRFTQNGQKVKSAPALMSLLHLDVYKVETRIDHIAETPRVSQVIDEVNATLHPDSLFLVNIQLPGDPELSVVMFWGVLPNQSPAARAEASKALDLLSRFLSPSENESGFRKARLKLAPRVVVGPWVVKQLVGKEAFVLGERIAIQYHANESRKYLEADCNISSSFHAKQVASWCRGAAMEMTVDLGFVLQGQDISELPERILGCVRLSSIDLSQAQPL